jgi:hypothetical protein
MASHRARLLSLTLASIAVLILVILSPFALTPFASDDRVDWDDLSTVAQTYSAVSAILAALALGGVVWSLFLQSQEARSNREQALRVLHADLLKMAMENPEYMACWGPFRPGTDHAQLRQVMYTNMIISHWEMMYELGALTESHLRDLSSDMFRGEPGQSFWKRARDRRMRTAHGRREVRFQRILDEEYQKVLREMDPPDPDP